MNQQRRKSVVSGYLFLLLISAVYSFTNTSLEIKGILSTSIIIIESLFFLLFLYFVGRYNIKKLLKIAFLLSIGGIHYLMARETVFLIMLMVAVIFTELEYRKAFKLLFFERLFFLILIVFFSDRDFICSENGGLQRWIGHKYIWLWIGLQSSKSIGI